MGKAQTMVEVMKIMATSFKRSQTHTATLGAPDPSAGHHWPMPPSETPGHTYGQIWVSFLWGLCSFFLGSGVHKVLFVPSKNLFPQSCVSFGDSMVGLMATSSKRAYAILRSVAPRAPAPTAGHCWPILLQETLKHSKAVWLSLCGVSWCAQGFVWALWASLAGMGFHPKCNFTPPTILLGLFLCPWTWGIFFFWWDPTFSYRWLLSSEL